MNSYADELLLISLHVRKPGCSPMLRSVTRRRGKDFDFTYNDHGHIGIIRMHMVDHLVANGWLRIVALDADTEYLSTTEAGRAIVEAHEARKRLSFSAPDRH